MIFSAMAEQRNELNTMNRDLSSRQVAMTVTKLDEGIMWLRWHIEHMELQKRTAAAFASAQEKEVPE